MAYVVSSACTWSRAHACVAVCPVDCFYEDETHLVISPEECIDCGACEPECPSLAIRYEEDMTHPDVVAAGERITGGKLKMITWHTPREPLAPAAHTARRDAFLADLARAASEKSRPELVRAIEAWLPAQPIQSGEGRPPTPVVADELLAILQECFPDRWHERVEDVRFLLTLPPWQRGESGSGDGDP